ncbi:hypothetical protein [Ferruginibacter sp.]
MNKTFILSTAFLLLLLFAGLIIFTIARNKKLTKEKEILILKNDSLHVLQLKTKNELALSRYRFDSMIQKKYKSTNTLKKRI